MSRRSWPNPSGPAGRPIGLVNPINAPETGDEIWVRDLPLPIASLGEFMEFIIHHELSNGQKTRIPTLSAEEVRKVLQPYNEWAPPPYSTNRIRGEGAATLFSACFSGLPDLRNNNPQAMFSALASFARPEEIDYELEICKQRLWAGMVPLCDRRWDEKKLDSPENIDLAAEYVLKACDMIMFSMPNTSRNMRQAYNRAYNVFAHFDTVLSAYYANLTPSTPRPTPVARLADLWAEYFFDHVKFITNRIHTWAAAHIDRLTDAILARLEAAPTVPGATRMSPQQEVFITQFEEIVHIIRRVDWMILFPLVGFKNTLPHWREASSPPIVNWTSYIRSHGATPLRGNYPFDIVQRDEVYHQRVASLVRQEMTRDRIARDVDARLASVGNVGAFAGEGLYIPMRGVRRVYAQGRRELRGEAEPIAEELWVGRLRRSFAPQRDGTPARYSKWGFVAYRLWYGHSAEQWATFLQRFEAGVSNWDKDVAGADQIKEKMEIRWVDGRDHAIAEGDVGGARKHFKTLQENEGAGLQGLDSPAFLVADKDCIDSYVVGFSMPRQTLIDEADLSPFILVATDDVEALTCKAPGYEGTVRVLGSVLLGDVWPCLWRRHVHLEEMWNLARLHPSCVYVGPVVQSQIEGWEKFVKVVNEARRKAVVWGSRGGSRT